jgi:hypothetical protein
MTPDEKVAAFLLRHVQGKEDAGDTAPAVTDLNNFPFWCPAWPPRWEHLTTCPAANIQVSDWRSDHTGYCGTCIEPVYRADFTVACEHEQPVEATWYCGVGELDAVLAALDWEP